MCQYLSNLTVRMKIKLGVGFSLALLILMSTVALTLMMRMNRVTTLIVTRPLPAIEALGRFNAASRGFRTTDYRYLVTLDEKTKSSVESRFDQQQQQAQQALDDYRHLAHSEDETNYNALQSEWNGYLAMHGRYLGMSRGQQLAAVTPYLNGSMQVQFLRVEKLLYQMMKWNRNDGKRLQREAQSAFELSRLLVIALSLAAVVTAGGAARLILSNVDHLLDLMRERQRSQEAIQASEERFRALIANAYDVIAIVETRHPNVLLRYISPAAETIWGYTPEALTGFDLLQWIHGHDAARFQALLQQASQNPGHNIGGELRLRKADGQWCSCEVTACDRQNEPYVHGIVLTCHDVTERNAFTEQITHQAFHDALTGLPNRALLKDRLVRALARAHRQGTAVAVIFMDLDNFKVINDSLGHEAGDVLLTTIAARLQRCVREADTVARLGGDEFTVLLEDIRREEDAVQVAISILEQLQTPIVLTGHEIYGSASLGIAVSTQAATDPDGLMRDADTAMYQAKTSGKASYTLFDPSMNAQAEERLELENDLRQALEQSEFRLLYQPIISLETGQIQEVEALLRWEHPTRGFIVPAKFILIAEETGLIVPIGRWVLEHACKQARIWETKAPDTPLIVGVNVSARQMQHSNWVASVSEVLEQTQLTPSRLKLELTESLMMQDFDGTILKLQQLKALGVRLAIDDFGTGYSSMAYLDNLPIDTLKIDRSFINRLGKTSDHGAVVQAIINLAKTLNLTVTSEGIETSEQLNLLQQMGAKLGQGYYFARPLTESHIDALLLPGATMLPATDSIMLPEPHADSTLKKAA